MERRGHVRHVLHDRLVRNITDAFHRRLQGEKVVATPRTQVLGNALGDPTVMGRNDLACVLPVDLVAVVRSGVVGSRDHDACAAVVGGNAEGLRGMEQWRAYDQGCEGELVESIHGNLLLREHLHR